jgi:hypothetical protein
VPGRVVLRVECQDSIAGRLTLSVGVLGVCLVDGILIERVAMDALINSVIKEVVVGCALAHNVVESCKIRESQIVHRIVVNRTMHGSLVNEISVIGAWQSGLLESVFVRSIVRKSRRNSVRMRSVVKCGLIVRILRAETMATLWRLQVVDQFVSARKSISCNASWTSMDVAEEAWRCPMIGLDVPCKVALACVMPRTDWLAEIAVETDTRRSEAISFEAKPAA